METHCLAGHVRPAANGCTKSSTWLSGYCSERGLASAAQRDPLQVRKATLASILAKASPGIRFNEHIEGGGPTVFAHACKLGLEGIVSKRKDSTYRSGRSPDWLKSNNPACSN